MADDRWRENERRWREGARGMTEEDRVRWAKSLYAERRGQERHGQARHDEDYGRAGQYRQRGYGAAPGWDNPRGYGEDYARDLGEQGYAGGYGRQAGGAYGQPEGGRGYEQSYGGARDRNRGWTGAGDMGYGMEQARTGHAGRGPKGYKRSDDRIREDVSDRLTDDWRVDASNIEVDVKDCEVTLRGTVDSREAKRCAEDCAEGVSGVRNVQNNLRVQQGTTAETSATGTAAAGTRASGSSAVRS